MNSGLRAGLGWYLDHIKTTPLLTAEQEKQLSRRVREHSDPIARQQMIQANLRLVVKIAKEYSSPGMTLNDLVAEGNLGLMRAVEDFDPEAGVRFSTYASWWIKQSIKRALINSGQPIHIPAYLAKLLSKWRRASNALEARLGRAATFEEIAKDMKLSKRKQEIVQQGLTAVNAPSQFGGDNPQTVSEMVTDTDAHAPDHDMLDMSNKPLVRKLLASLGERERRILELRFNINDDYEGPQRTFKEIGEIIGLTRERVRQLEKKALEDLKAATEKLVG